LGTWEKVLVINFDKTIKKLTLYGRKVMEANLCGENHSKKLEGQQYIITSSSRCCMYLDLFFLYIYIKVKPWKQLLAFMIRSFGDQNTFVTFYGCCGNNQPRSHWPPSQVGVSTYRPDSTRLEHLGSTLSDLARSPQSEHLGLTRSNPARSPRSSRLHMIWNNLPNLKCQLGCS
jgi:hypothetical protein